MSTTTAPSTTKAPTELPTTTQVAILRQVAAEKHPKLALGNIAFHHDVLLPDLQAFLGRHGYPDPQKLRAAADTLDGTAGPQQTPPPRVPVATSSTPPATVLTQPDEIRALINTAKGHASKRIQAAANHLIDDIDKLKRLIAEDQEKHAARRAAEAETAAARAEVERLQAALVAAKAKLGGGKKKSSSTAERSDRLPRGEFPCSHDGCDRVFDTNQGRSMHERLRCAHRPDPS